MSMHFCTTAPATFSCVSHWTSVAVGSRKPPSTGGEKRREKGTGEKGREERGAEGKITDVSKKNMVQNASPTLKMWW